MHSSETASGGETRVTGPGTDQRVATPKTINDRSDWARCRQESIVRAHSGCDECGRMGRIFRVFDKLARIDRAQRDCDAADTRDSASARAQGFSDGLAGVETTTGVG